MAGLLGVSPPTVQAAIRNGRFGDHARKDGRIWVFDGPACVEAFAANRQCGPTHRTQGERYGSNGSTSEESGGGDGLWKAKERHEVAKAELAELRLEEERGSLVRVDAVEREAAEVASVVQSRILAIPARLADRLAATSKPARIRSLLEGEIRRALETLGDLPNAGKKKRRKKK